MQRDDHFKERLFISIGDFVWLFAGLEIGRVAAAAFPDVPIWAAALPVIAAGLFLQRGKARMFESDSILIRYLVANALLDLAIGATFGAVR